MKKDCKETCANTALELMSEDLKALYTAMQSEELEIASRKLFEADDSEFNQVNLLDNE